MIIPTAPQLRSEDMDRSAQGWIGRLLSPLNTFMASATAAINGRLSFQDNILGQENTASFTYAANTLPLTFALNFKGVPKELVVGKALENGSPVIVLAAWEFSSNTIRITDLVKLSGGAVSALTVGATYNLTVRVAA